MTPWLIGRLLDLIVTGTSRQTVTNYLIVIGVLVLSQFALSFLGEYLSRAFGQAVFAKLREDLVNSVTHMPLSVVESAGTGDLIGRTTHDIDRIHFGSARYLPHNRHYFHGDSNLYCGVLGLATTALSLLAPLIPMGFLLAGFQARGARLPG